MRNLEIDSDLRYSTGDSFSFDENFEILRYSGHRECSISLYVDYGNLSKEYELEQDCIIEDSRENRVKIQRHLTQDGYRRVSEVYGTLEELAEEAGSVDYSDIEELWKLCDELDIEYTSNYVRMSTRGYSQGDYAEILVNIAEFEKVVGAEFKEEAYQKWFDHYFWDSPIYGEINVSFDYTKNAVNFTYDEMFEFNEFTNDEYDIDGLEIDGIVNYIKANVKFPLSEPDLDALENKLTALDYQDVKSPSCGC